MNLQLYGTSALLDVLLFLFIFVKIISIIVPYYHIPPGLGLDTGRLFALDVQANKMVRLRSLCLA